VRKSIRQSGPMSWPVSSARSLGVIGGRPTPGARSVTAPERTFTVDLGNHVTVAGQQRAGGAHLRAERQLALGDAVAAVLLVFDRRVVGLRAACTVGALIHFSARAEVRRLRILRCAERAGVEAVAAPDADVLVVEDDADLGLVDALDRADCDARRIRAVHAGDRDRLLAGLAVVQCHEAAAVDAPGHVVLVLAGGGASVAFDAALRVA